MDHYSATIDTSFTPSSFLHDILDVQSASTTNTAVNDPAALYHTPEFLRTDQDTSVSVDPNDFSVRNPAIIHYSVLETSERPSNVSIDYTKDEIVHELVGNRGCHQIGLNGFQCSHGCRKTLADGTVQRYWQCLGKTKLKCTARLMTASDTPPTYSLSSNPTAVNVARV